MTNIYNYSFQELSDYFVAIGEKSFRAQQVFRWLYQKKVNSFSEMANIKKELLVKLEEDFALKKIKIIDQKKTPNAQKYLFSLSDEHKIEAVLLKQNYGYSLCVSTQVGCAMGCLFCASGPMQKKRNLMTYEMVQQILLIEEASGINITHVVLMGVGEPFDNYDNVMKFIDTINNPYGMQIGARHITISTCGLVPKINQFAQSDKQVNLAVSLNAPNNELRDFLMPINKKYPLEELMISLKNYYQKTKRRITFEYIMLADVNDHDKHAYELVKLVKDLNCYINLIPYNKTEHGQFQATNLEQMKQFYDIIKKSKINVTVRKELGADIWAACGQLRVQSEEE